MGLAAVDHLYLSLVPVTDLLSYLLSFCTLGFRTVIDGDYPRLVGPGFAQSFEDNIGHFVGTGYQILVV